MKFSQARQEFLEYMKAVKNCSNDTYEHYGRYLERFAQVIGIEEVEELKVEHVWKFQSYLSGKVGNNTKNFYLIGIRSFLTYCYLKDIPTLLPHKVVLGKKEETVRDYLNDEQVGLLMSKLKERTYKHARDKAILMLLYSSGLRCGELVALNVSDIKPGATKFQIRGKGKKVRWVYMSTEARLAINEYLATRDDNYSPLFINFRSRYKHEGDQNKQRRLSKSGVENLVRFYAKQAGIKGKICPHSLRHTFATTLLQKKVDIMTIKELMGHKLVNTTQIYLHLGASTVEAEHQRVFN